MRVDVTALAVGLPVYLSRCQRHEYPREAESEPFPLLQRAVVTESRPSTVRQRQPSLLQMGATLAGKPSLRLRLVATPPYFEVVVG